MAHHHDQQKKKHLVPAKDAKRCRALIAKLVKLRASLVELEARFAKPLARIHPSHRPSARNLLHYVAFRGHDMRRMQRRLTEAGLSSLGHSEAAVLDSLNAVIAALRRLAGLGPEKAQAAFVPPVSLDEGHAILQRQTKALLGRRPERRSARVMVTLPTEAADDGAFVRNLVKHGMNVARINCAHDDAATWRRMARNVRRAARDLKAPCRVVMDLAGPKLRTGPVNPGLPVVKLRPERDRFGQVAAPAIVRLVGDRSSAAADDPAALVLPAQFLRQLSAGDTLRFRDGRAARRSMLVTGREAGCWTAAIRDTAYVTAGTKLVARRPAGGHKHRAVAEAKVLRVPCGDDAILLRRGDHLLLTRTSAKGTPPVLDGRGRLVRPARVGCTLPQVFDGIRRGHAVWFDDGKVGGTVESVRKDGCLVRITHARPRGDRLRGGKGVNLPDTELDLSAITRRDAIDARVVARQADIVALSFVLGPDDVRRLQRRLAKLGGRCHGIILKIEMRRAFELLPELILAAMSSPAIGIMIARGDLAIECGYERLAEIQEEILWICEAAHVPVVWATQVLENLARDGQPSRAEITDAAMSERAECVMLNKGPHIIEAIDLLDRILRRMEAHQHKKRAMLRRLRFWTRVQRRIAAWQG
jgi:pyruvate kinase